MTPTLQLSGSARVGILEGQLQSIGTPGLEVQERHGNDLGDLRLLVGLVLGVAYQRPVAALQQRSLPTSLTLLLSTRLLHGLDDQFGDVEAVVGDCRVWRQLGLPARCLTSRCYHDATAASGTAATSGMRTPRSGWARMSRLADAVRHSWMRR